MKKVLILLNEADPILARVCRNKFQKQEGWESLITSSCEEAMRAFLGEELDLVLTEIILADPMKTGFDFIREARNAPDSPNANVPIVVFSKLGQKQDMEQAMSLGATKYFDKNKYTLPELIAELKKMLV